MTMTDVLTTADIALRLSVSLSQVQRWCRTGRLPAIKRGGNWWISPVALAVFQAIIRKPGYPAGRKRKENTDHGNSTHNPSPVRSEGPASMGQATQRCGPAL